jgi:hypothetical protein
MGVIRLPKSPSSEPENWDEEGAPFPATMVLRRWALSQERPPTETAAMLAAMVLSSDSMLVRTRTATAGTGSGVIGDGAASERGIAAFGINAAAVQKGRISRDGGILRVWEISF